MILWMDREAPIRKKKNHKRIFFLSRKECVSQFTCPLVECSNRSKEKKKKKKLYALIDHILRIMTKPRVRQITRRNTSASPSHVISYFVLQTRRVLCTRGCAKAKLAFLGWRGRGRVLVARGFY